jgi:hypothetical protein
MDFADKTGILGQLWIEFRDDPQFKVFIEYNDIGLPMAYMVAEGLIKELTPLGEQYIDESFKMLMDLLEVEESVLDEVLFDKNLGAVLLFAYQKKQNKTE